MRCAAKNGKGWQCAAEALPGKRRCQHHTDAQARYVRSHRERMSPPRRRRVDRNGQLRQRYGITLDDYRALLIQQGGVCAICRQAETHMKRGKVCELSVDHDHETGRVRGLLCNNCNRGLGFLKDDPILLTDAAAYLRGVLAS